MLENYLAWLVAERETDRDMIAKNLNRKVKYLKTMDMSDSKKKKKKNWVCLIGGRAEEKFDICLFI